MTERGGSIEKYAFCRGPGKRKKKEKPSANPEEKERKESRGQEKRKGGRYTVRPGRRKKALPKGENPRVTMYNIDQGRREKNL